MTDESATKRILIADDADVVTTVLAAALEVSGYEVVSVGDGKRALEMGRNEDFNLAIIDQFMPGMLGIEILETWRNDDISLPVIILSGVDDDDLIVKVLDLGAADFVRKPFRPTELLARIKKHID
jgi:DNA-binding response OmpR family regulator